MQSPPQIDFKGMATSEFFLEDIHREIAELEKWFNHIVTMRVVVEAPSPHHRHGSHYRVNLVISIPGEDVVVSREPGRDERHEDAHCALRDAFKAARRQLRHDLKRRRGRVKHHEAPPTARVLQLHHGTEDGFLITDDGREIYFHKNAVLDADFHDLGEGVRVLFVEEQGIEGPQASTVRVL